MLFYAMSSISNRREFTTETWFVHETGIILCIYTRARIFRVVLSADFKVNIK